MGSSCDTCRMDRACLRAAWGPRYQMPVQCRPRALRRPRLAAANRTTERDFGDLAASWGDPRHTVVLFLELLGDGVLIYS
jgi:hypothetical protein